MVRKERADNVNAAWHARTDLELSHYASPSSPSKEEGKEEEEKKEAVEEEEEWLRSVDRGLMT